MKSIPTGNTERVSARVDTEAVVEKLRDETDRLVDESHEMIKMMRRSSDQTKASINESRKQMLTSTERPVLDSRAKIEQLPVREESHETFAEEVADRFRGLNMYR